MFGKDTKVILLTGAAHGQAHLFILCLAGIQIPFAAELGLDDAQIGLLATVMTLFFGLGAFPAGLMADRWGARPVLILYLLGASLGAMLASFARTYTEAMLALALMGASASLYHPAGLALVTRTVKMRGKALGYHGMAGSLAIAFAAAISGGVADIFGTWRAAFRVVALIGFLILPGILFLREGTGDDPKNARGGRQDGDGSTLAILITIYTLLVILGFTYRGVLTFLPKYLSQGVNLPGIIGENAPAATKGGVLNGLVLLAGVLGQWIGGTLSHKFRLQSLTVVLSFLTAGALIWMGFAANAPLLLASFLFAGFYFTLQPVGNGLVAEYTTVKRRGLGFAIHFTLAFGLGSLGAGFTGLVSTAYGGLARGMLVNGLLTLLAGGLAIFLWRLTRAR